jgi:hypothetical protein
VLEHSLDVEEQQSRALAGAYIVSDWYHGTIDSGLAECQFIAMCVA